MLKKVGVITGQLLRLYEDNKPAHYDILKRIYEEQFIEIEADKPNEKGEEQNIRGDALETKKTNTGEGTSEGTSEENGKTLLHPGR